MAVAHQHKKPLFLLCWNKYLLIYRFHSHSMNLQLQRFQQSISCFIYTDADGGPAVFVLGSTLGGIFIGLLVLLLIFVLYLRQRRNRGFEPLIKADFTNRKYTEEA